MSDSAADVAALLTTHANDPVECWRALCAILPECTPYERYLELHNQVFGERSIGAGDGAAPAWVPSESEAVACNASRLADTLGHGTGGNGYRKMIAWAAQAAHRDAVWRALRQQLAVPAAGERINIVRCAFAAAPAASTALVTGDAADVSVSYGQLEALAKRAAVMLQTKTDRFAPLGAGSRLGLVMPMTVQSTSLVLGAIGIGAAVVSAAESFSAREIATRMQIGGATVICTVDHFVRMGKKILLGDRVRAAAKIANIPVLVFDAAGELLQHDDINGDALLEAANVPNDFEWPLFEEQQCTHILFSSGTTSTPKGIPWSQTTPLRCAVDAYVHLDTTKEDTLMFPTSWGWMMGPWLLWAAMLNGARFVLPPCAPAGDAFYSFCDKANVTIVGLVPSMVNAWKGDTMKRPDALKSVRAAMKKVKCFFSTGEASNSELYLWLMTLPPKIRPALEYVGGTEIGGGFLSGSLAVPAVASAFASTTIGLNVVLLDDDGAIIEGEGEGELTIVPPSIGLSTTLLNKDHDEVYYKGMPKYDGVTLRRHGDRMRRLGGDLVPGYYVACGRADDTMNIGGVKVSSRELEQAIVCNVSGLKEVAAVGVSPANGGPERLFVFAVQLDNGSASPKSCVQLFNESRAALREQLNPLFKLADLFVVDKLPRTASAKIMRRSLRERVRQADAISAKGSRPSAVIVAMARTPFGQAPRGFLKKISAVELGVAAAKAACARSGIAPSSIEAAYVGCVCAAGLGQNVARQIAIGARASPATPGTTINKVCASGTVAIALAAKSVWLGENDILLAGGTESMSNVPVYAPLVHSPLLAEAGQMRAGLMVDGLMDAYSRQAMGVLADRTALAHKVTREQQDDFAVRSFQRAQADDALEEEGVDIAAQLLGAKVPAADEGVSKLNEEKLRQLRPAFIRDESGTITAGNASTLADGSAMVIVMSERAAVLAGVKPIAKIVSFADGAVEPSEFAMAPATAVPLALKRANCTLADMAAIEINEAFAAVPVAVGRGLGLSDEDIDAKVNRFGGAVARGHPLGASGARIALALIRALDAGEKGVLGVCNGGGGASAMVLEKL